MIATRTRDRLRAMAALFWSSRMVHCVRGSRKNLRARVDRRRLSLCWGLGQTVESISCKKLDMRCVKFLHDTISRIVKRKIDEMRCPNVKPILDTSSSLD